MKRRCRQPLPNSFAGLLRDSPHLSSGAGSCEVHARQSRSRASSAGVARPRTVHHGPATSLRSNLLVENRSEWVKRHGLTIHDGDVIRLGDIEAALLKQQATGIPGVRLLSTNSSSSCPAICAGRTAAQTSYR